MAAVSVLNFLAIPGLHGAPTIDDLKESSTLYNQLPHAGTQLQIPKQHLQNVLAMMEHHKVEKLFGAHLIHRHDQIGKGMLRVEAALKTRRGSWTEPSAIDNLDVNNIHGHVFKLLPDERFIAYEYGEGSPPTSLASADPAFFRELKIYLLKNNLTDLIGLEVLHGDQPQRMVEFEMHGGGTVLLPEWEANYGSLDRPTGWAQRGKDGPTDPDGEPDPGTHWAKTTTGKHKVFVDGMEPKDEEELVAGLAAEDILRI